MAFGFPAYHEEEVTIPAAIGGVGLLAVLSQLGWTGGATGDGRAWRGSTGMSLASWGETIIIQWTSNSTVRVRSECAMPTQCFDWGRNKRNIDRLRLALSPVPVAF